MTQHGSDPAAGPATGDELRRSDERLGLFAGQVSHDLRNPLTAVSMSLQMLQEQPSVMEDDEALWMVERALAGAERMNGLIEELLEYAQLGSLTLAEVDLNRVAADVVDDLAVALRDASLEVAEMPVVYADRALLRALLRHLVANAARFTRPDSPSRIILSGTRTDAGWRIEVADNGPGVPPADRDRVFELLARQDKKTGGAGIGLATCKRIAEAHGGSIGMAESTAGGALVWVELPDRR